VPILIDNLTKMKDSKKEKSFRNEGNLEYRQSKFYEALISYNKSLCYAENSDSLGSAYANRSAVYLQLKEADKCLENIQLARDHKYPNEQKLKERQKQAEDLKETQREDPENNPANLIKLTYSPDVKYPSIANCLELRKNDQFGRHVVTKRALNPGDIVCLEPMIVKTTLADGNYKRCRNCLKSNYLNLIPCDKCSMGKFWNVLST
jgi:SET and MYND domain-containing protein 4